MKNNLYGNHRRWERAAKRKINLYLTISTIRKKWEQLMRRRTFWM